MSTLPFKGRNDNGKSNDGALALGLTLDHETAELFDNTFYSSTLTVVDTIPDPPSPKSIRFPSVKRMEESNSDFSNDNHQLEQLARTCNASIQIIKEKLDQLEQKVDFLLIKDQRYKSDAFFDSGAIPLELSNAQLEEACMPTMLITPEPSNIQTNVVLADLDEKFPMLDRRRMKSQVSKWFRKRRERFGYKIHNAFKRRYPKVLLDKKESESLLRLMDEDLFPLEEVLADAEISFLDLEAGKAFCREKVRLLLNANKR